MSSIPPAPVPATASIDLQGWLRSQEEIALLVAHDLRNPLAAILANLSYLEMSLDPEAMDAREAVGDIRLSSQMLLRMIENYVALARLESPRAITAPRAGVSLAATARDVTERLQAAAQSNSVTLTARVTDEDTTVAADQQLFELMAENLLGNAIAFARGARQAEVAVTTHGEFAVLTLTDTGDPFGPVDRDFSREGQLEIKKVPEARYSRGLALYLVGLVVRSFDGTLEAGTRGGRTTLTLSFPRVRR